MIRRNRLIYISIFTVLALLGGLYALSPWFLAMVIRDQLENVGMHNMQLDVEYPGFAGVSIHNLSFNGSVAGSPIQAEVPQIDIQYHWPQLIRGQLHTVYIKAVTAEIQAIKNYKSKTDGQPAPMLPIGFLSGQWLVNLPLQQFTLEKLIVKAKTVNKEVYRLHLFSQIREQSLQMVGQLYLPKLSKPLNFLAGTQSTGQAHVYLIPGVEDETPLFTLEVSPQDRIDEKQVAHLKGTVQSELLAYYQQHYRCYRQSIRFYVMLINYKANWVEIGKSISSMVSGR